LRSKKRKRPLGGAGSEDRDRVSGRSGFSMPDLWDRSFGSNAI
jgi:hypothetical protein